MKYSSLFAALLCALPLSAAQSADPIARDWVTRALETVCPEPELLGLEAQTRLPGSWLLEETRRPESGPPRRVAVELLLPNTDKITLERRGVGERLQQFRVRYFYSDGVDFRPGLMAIADGNCTTQSARAFRDGVDGWRYLDQLEGDLETLRWTETIQAPWPDGSDPGGVRVGLVDSGLAYDLDLFRARLARDAEGTPIGYDYWDMDPLPYDGDVSRGPFLPIRHGTAVASVLAQEAPNTALVPYRYPRPDMSRLSVLVAQAAADGVRILAMPLGSRREADWTAFAAAIAEQDMLAIVSAGNDGRDIDVEPLYPAGLDLDHVLVVTSADAFGRLAEGSNWGVESVDIMLPAENVEITDFRGAKARASGSSYAVPRLAALAARILEREPGLAAVELKARILALAAPSPFEPKPVVSAGWIPDPLAD